MLLLTSLDFAESGFRYIILGVWDGEQGCINSRSQMRIWKHPAGGRRGAVAAKGVTSVFPPSSSEKLLAEKPPNEALELIFEGVPETPGPTDPGPAKAPEGGKNIPEGSQKEAEEKAPGQAGQAKVQGDTSRGIEFQAVPSEKSEVGQALCPTAREEDCFQILGRPGAGGRWGCPGAEGGGKGPPCLPVQRTALL